MNCGDCKHWAPDRNYIGLNLAIERSAENRPCGAISDDTFTKEKPPAVLAVYGYEADGSLLLTAANFSCSLWEAK